MSGNRAVQARSAAESAYPTLAQFFGCSLHEDWLIDSGTPETAVDDAIAASPIDHRRQVRRELAALLSRTDDDTRLRGIMNDGLGVKVLFRKAADARLFAEQTERKLREAIEAHFEPPRRPSGKDL